MGAVKNIDGELIAVDDIQDDGLRRNIPASILLVEQALDVFLSGIAVWADATNFSRKERSDQKYGDAYGKRCIEMSLELLQLREELVKLTKFSSKKVI